MNEEQVRKIIQEELASFMGNDKFMFQKLIQIFDGRNIQLGKTTGTKIGTETTQKIGFYGITPVTQQNVPLTSPAVQDVIDALVANGLVEQSD